MKLKNLFGLLLIWAVVFLRAVPGEAQEWSMIEKGFKLVPDSVQLAVYWYWISDNLSEEGVVHDLQAMHEVGINRAYIGFIGVDGVPVGNVKFLSEEWWKVLHVALKKAGELGIQIGIFNSPGWSQSGGPWVKPEEAMRNLVSMEMEISGPGRKVLDLPKLGKDMQDVRVIAYPAFRKEEYQKSWVLDKKENASLAADLKLEQRSMIRSISFEVNTPVKTHGTLYVKEQNSYKLLKTFEIDRSNPALHVGFEPYAPIVLSLPETEASEYHISLDKEGEGQITIILSERPMVERFAEKSLSKMFQEPLPMWGEYMWSTQPESTSDIWTLNSQNVLDITACLNGEGKLVWDVPEGKWIISRIAMKPTGVTNSPATLEATGLEVDKMSRKHIYKHLDAFIGEILKRIPPDDRNTFNIIVEDSYETGSQNWTDEFIELFTKRYGYSPLLYLPVMKGVVVDNKDCSDRFLWDLRRFVADCVAYDYVGGLRDWAHRHGLTTWLENYGHWGFPAEFLQYGGQSDEISGEFWSEGSLGDIENRAASSCGHIYGKRKIWAESCTSGGPVFSRYPQIMKQRVDRFFTEGINATLLHLYIHQAYEDKEPGLAAWFGNEFNRKNTWFYQMDVFADYLKRCNFMLQQGRYVADVTYFIGEDVPKMTGVCDPPLPKGYSFDYINAEVLMKYATVREGKLVLDSGMEYRVLVLPKQETMRPELLVKLKEMVMEGLTILGPAPRRSPSMEGYPEADKKLEEIALQMWRPTEKTQAYMLGKGIVYEDGCSLAEIFENMQLTPNFKVSEADSSLLFIHRTLEDADIYFLSNSSEEKITVAPIFRIYDKQPEAWNPQTSEIRVLPEFSQVAEGIKVPLVLEPLESIFVIFKEKPCCEVGNNYPKKVCLRTLEGPWNLAFNSEKRGPSEIIVLDKLEDWSKNEDERIKYYSGSVMYTHTFDLERMPADEVYIDLGKVMVMARVWLNGEYVGGVWTYPHRLNIKKYLRKGENELQIEVVNNWKNRLIGDFSLPKEDRRTWTNQSIWTENSPLQPSGLLGPVEIQSYKYRLK